TVDCDQKVLFRNGSPLPLAPKVFDTLLILVEKGGRIVEKEALMNRVWPDTFVEETNLTFNIQQLRKALGDNARKPLFIETVARRGYRFIANLEQPANLAEVASIQPHTFGTSEIELPNAKRSAAHSAKRRAKVLGAAAAILLVLVTGIGLWRWRSSRQPQ